MSKASDLRSRSGAAAPQAPVAAQPKLDAVVPDEPNKNTAKPETGAPRAGQAHAQNSGGGKAPVGRRPKV